MVSECRSLTSKGVCWSIENPSNSLIWHYPDLESLAESAHWTDFHVCMYGSKRKKSTAVVSNRTWFLELDCKCDGQCEHLLWGLAATETSKVWATSLESAYTWELSRAWVACAMQGLGVSKDSLPGTLSG